MEFFHKRMAFGLTLGATATKNQQHSETYIMLKYRARLCPKCDYYVGFSLPTPVAKTRQVSVTNFCLNCNYKLPVHSIVRGGGKQTRSVRRTPLRLVHRTAAASATDSTTQPRAIEVDARINPTDYSRHLRAI